MAVSVNAYNHAETLQKLERLNQLETVVAEQRIRIEKYRTMYETLKTEHEQNEDSKKRKENDIKSLQNEIKSIEAHCKELVSQARQERDIKIEECEELRLKVMTPQKLEVMKMKLQEEVETPFKQRIEALEIEVDKYRNEFNRLRYDYSFLKSEYEHEITQKKAVLEEAQRQFQLEKESLEKQISTLTDELNNQDPADLMKTRMLQKENTQLNIRVKSFLSELEDLRDKKESTNLQNDQVSRFQAKQLSDLSLQCKTLEAERETSKLQLERLQKELEKSSREQDTLSSDVHRLERENFQLKSQLEEKIHSSKMEVNNIKLSLMKDRSELEQERDSLRMELNLLKNKYNVCEKNLNDLKKALELKEEDLVKRVQSVKEQEWSRINQLENAQAQLESQLAAADQRKLDADASFKFQLEKLEENSKIDRDNKEKCERELASVRSSLLQEKQKIKNLENDIEKLTETKQKYQRLVQEYDNLSSTEQQLKSDVDKMANTIELMRKELEMAQEDLQQQREMHQKAQTDSKAKYDEEKKKSDKRYAEIQKEHRDLKKKHEKLSQTAKKKTKRLKSEVANLTDQLHLMKTKEEQCEIERNALMKNLNFQQERMKRKFNKIRQRQNHFSQVLNATDMNGFPSFSPIKRTSSLLLNDDEAGDADSRARTRSQVPVKKNRNKVKFSAGGSDVNRECLIHVLDASKNDVVNKFPTNSWKFLATVPPRSRVSPTVDAMESTADENHQPLF